MSIPSMLSAEFQEKVNQPGTAVYIDGFNLFYGLRALKNKAGCYYWLDLYALSERLVRENPLARQDDWLSGAYYFTSPIKPLPNDPLKERRQARYFAAINETGVQVTYGKYQLHKIQCGRCGNLWVKGEEKQTDVNIAVALVSGAYEKHYQKAILISSDSDLAGAVELVTQGLGLPVTVAFPPMQPGSQDLINAGTAKMDIKPRWVQEHQLQNPVIRMLDKYKIYCPEEWQ